MSTIQEIQNTHLIKTTKKIIEKLIFQYRNKKINKDEYNQKLEKLKKLITDKISEIKKNQVVLNKKMSKSNDLNAFITEYFVHIGCFETGKAYAKKMHTEEFLDLDFYEKIFRIRKQIIEGEQEDALGFIKEYRNEFKSSKDETARNIENSIKVEIFVKLCYNQKSQEALEFVNREFKKIPEKIKAYLPMLVSSNKSEKHQLKNSIQVANFFFSSALKIFQKTKIPRLAKRIEYGLMAYKTYHCVNNISENCPSCCKALKLRLDLPYNKHEISILLCKKTFEIMDDLNPPYAFDDGSVYGSNYLEKIKNICVFTKTSDNISRYPKLCFIV